jgi:MOSC domain-containing protein
VPEAGTVVALRRYPVKSMLGEDLTAVQLTPAGLEGDRFAAVIDQETGNVATAKHPRLWRGLLAFGAEWNDGSPRILLPGGDSVAVTDDAAARLLSGALHRDVRLTTVRPDQAIIDRPDPEDVIAAGDDADVPYQTLQIGQGTTGTNFVDFAPVHLITTATLAHVGEELIRYRPNLVLDLPGAEPYAENDWIGRTVAVGPARLRIMIPTPRCAVPTLAHGDLPRRASAVRTLLGQNRITVPDLDMVAPCLGAYAQVETPGPLTLGTPAALL